MWNNINIYIYFSIKDSYSIYYYGNISLQEVGRLPLLKAQSYSVITIGYLVRRCRITMIVSTSQLHGSVGNACSLRVEGKTQTSRWDKVLPRSLIYELLCKGRTPGMLWTTPWWFEWRRTSQTVSFDQTPRKL